jgi:hypothetical protein
MEVGESKVLINTGIMILDAAANTDHAARDAATP